MGSSVYTTVGGAEERSRRESLRTEESLTISQAALTPVDKTELAGRPEKPSTASFSSRALERPLRRAESYGNHGPCGSRVRYLVVGLRPQLVSRCSGQEDKRATK